MRVCYIVANEGADKEKIRREIVTMPNYFSDYDTEVNFITEEEMKKNHTTMPHGGGVIRTGSSSASTNHKIEFGLTLDSNPEFTASVLVAYARAATKLYKEGQRGSKTIFDIPFSYLSPKSKLEQIAEML